MDAILVCAARKKNEGNQIDLDQLSYQQRQTLRGLRWVGGIGKRREIAESADLDGTQVASALTELRKDGLVENLEGAKWGLTDIAASLLQKDSAVRESGEKRELPKDQIDDFMQTRQKLMDEFRKLANKHIRELPFSPADAEWLCAAFADQFRDMPTISVIMKQMAEYWSCAK